MRVVNSRRIGNPHRAVVEANTLTLFYNIQVDMYVTARPLLHASVAVQALPFRAFPVLLQILGEDTNGDLALCVTDGNIVGTAVCASPRVHA
jgi:hypothetical protein